MAQFEPMYNAWGFAMCLAAAASRALKSVMQEVLLSDGYVINITACALRSGGTAAMS